MGRCSREGAHGNCLAVAGRHSTLGSGVARDPGGYQYGVAGLSRYGRRRLTAAALAAVAAINLPILFIQARLTRLLSFTRLVWLPLAFVLLSQLFAPDAAQIDTATRGFMVAIVAVNGISLPFDFIEMWRWSRGERELLGL